jgi:glycerol-3-phosphate dehydrogenase (NAD(P)+)
MRAEGVAIVGGGAWGLSLAAAAARKTEGVLLVSRRSVEVAMPGVEVVHDLGYATARARTIVLAVPSKVALEFTQTVLKDAVTPEHIVLHSGRGLVGDELATMNEVIARETPARLLGVVGGPVLPGDLLAGEPSVAVCGASDDIVGRSFIDAFMTPELRVYTTSDLKGVEWAAALVGCIAIVVGYGQQIGLGPGALAAAMTRSMHEAALLTEAAGGTQRTLFGLAGYGDLLAALSQRTRAEVLLGVSLARGRNIEEAVREVRARVEGADLFPRLSAWAKERKIRVPIFDAMAHSVFFARSPDELIHELMTMPVTDPG